MSHNPWYALKVRPRSEWMVAESLTAKGYELFLPTYTCKKQWSDRVKTSELPLFPGYLFCQFDVRKRLPILTTPGVNFIVGIGKTPEPIALEELESIQKVVRSGFAYTPHPYLNIGEQVRIERGSLAGLVGLITEVRNEARLILSINLLMRSVSVEIDRSWVEPLRRHTHDQFQPVA